MKKKMEKKLWSRDKKGRGTGCPGSLEGRNTAAAISEKSRTTGLWQRQYSNSNKRLTTPVVLHGHTRPTWSSPLEFAPTVLSRKVRCVAYNSLSQTCIHNLPLLFLCSKTAQPTNCRAVCGATHPACGSWDFLVVGYFFLATPTTLLVTHLSTCSVHTTVSAACGVDFTVEVNGLVCSWRLAIITVVKGKLCAVLMSARIESYSCAEVCLSVHAAWSVHIMNTTGLVTWAMSLDVRVFFSFLQ